MSVIVYVSSHNRFVSPDSLNSHYRGTHRAVPSHCDEMPDDQEINRLFFWYLDEGGEEGVVRDAAKALRFAELWNERLPKDEQFEVVEVTEGNEPPSGGGSLLGFDISSGLGGYSLLAGWLSEIPKVEGLPDAIWEMSNLLARFYGPQLNAFGLFCTRESAAMCLRSMVAMQSLSPNMYESGDVRDFRVLGVYLLGTAKVEEKSWADHKRP